MFKGLIFDNEMYNFLSFATRESIIAQILLNGDHNYMIEVGNYIKMEKDDIDVISFLPISKYVKVEDVWGNGRVKVKIGRFLNKVLNSFSKSKFSIDDKSIEHFVNLYKSFFSRDITKLKIVKGDDIMKYYLEENYHRINGNRSGVLWNSCMRQSERNSFMKLYANNPDISMLVFFSDDNKVRARALLWDNIKDHKNSEITYKVMDRIYYIYDHDVSFFKDWARENGYISKAEQNSKSENYFDDGTKIVRLDLYAILSIKNLYEYPYLDTFKFFNISKLRFSNSSDFNYDYVLIQSSGGLERERVHDDDDDDVFHDDWQDNDM